MEHLGPYVERAARWSVISKEKLHILADIAGRTRDLEGDVAELGVYYGGSAILLATILPNKKVHAFDSFEGLTDLSMHDRLRTAANARGHLPGDFGIANRRVIASIAGRLTCAGIHLYRGIFNLTKKEIEDHRFCFAHFDADTYSSAVEFLEFFYPRLVLGGNILFDDYGWEATPGVKRAVDDFSAEWGIPVIKLDRHQAVIVKE